MVVLKPNIVRGGRAIGLGNNFYLMKGRTHSKGGIDVGKNPKTGLEVENNEVMQVSPQGIRVFSAQPILGGISPAQYILGGANPNQVFNAQEEWKKINKINDDGTRKAEWGKEENWNLNNKNKYYGPIRLEVIDSALKEIEKPTSPEKYKKANEILSAANSENSYYNSNYPYYEYVTRKDNDDIQEKLNNDNNYKIPYIKSKYIKLTKAGKLSGVELSTNMLDSLYKYSIQANIPFSDALGIAGTETGFGKFPSTTYLSSKDIKKLEEDAKNKGISSSEFIRNKGVNPTDLLNYHAYFRNSYNDLIGAVVRKIGKDEFAHDATSGYVNAGIDPIRLNYDGEQIETLLKNGYKYADKTYEKIKNNNPLLNAFLFYKNNNYNPGDTTTNNKIKQVGLEIINSPEIQKYLRNKKKYGGIHIKPSKRGTFTAAAKKHGMSVQGFANKVLANKGNYSSAMVKKANFARNASKWKHKEFGGDMDFNYWITKDNIYKLGGRKKGAIGLYDIPYATEEQVKKLITDEIGLGISNKSQRIVNNALSNNSRLLEPPLQNTIDRNNALRSIASNQPAIKINNPLDIGTIGNIIGTGINIAGNLISYGINNRALNRMRRPSMPLPLRAENLQTRVSTAAQEAAIRENVAGQEELISGNLASSRSRLNAINRVRNQGTSMYNQLQDRKQNIETELINRNKLNRQQIGNQNVLQFNNWRNISNEFDNKIIDLGSENGVNLIQGISDATAGEKGYIENIENNARYRMNAFLTTIANPDAFKAMNSTEIKRLARQFGITNRQLRDLGINV